MWYKKSQQKEPWEMTLEEWSTFKYPPISSPEKFPQVQRVIQLLKSNNIDILDIQVKGSHAWGVLQEDSDIDIFVKVPPEQFHAADDIVAPLINEGIDVSLNWEGYGKPGGTLRCQKTHKRLVEKAIKEGKPVPRHVIESYPELKALKKYDNPKTL